MLTGRAENLLYNLQASTYTENGNHLNSDHNHIVLIREDKMFKSLLLITFRGKIEKNVAFIYFFLRLSQKNIQITIKLLSQDDSGINTLFSFLRLAKMKIIYTMYHKTGKWALL